MKQNYETELQISIVGQTAPTIQTGDGVVLSPSSTKAGIDGADEKVLITKEWFNANTNANTSNGIVELKNCFKTAYLAYFKYFDYLPSGDLHSVTIYDSSAKTVKLFTKTFTYQGSDLVLVVTEDNTVGNRLETTIGYEDGNISLINDNFIFA